MSIEPLAVPVDTWDLFTPSDENDRFESCRACGRSIKKDTPQYVIEREFTRTEPGAPAELAYEFTICESCLADQDASYSPDSQEHIAQFYSDVIDLNVRAEQLLADTSSDEIPNIDAWVERCAVTGMSVEDATRFRVMAYAVGEWLLLAGMPVVMTETALERLESGLSDTTKERARTFATDALHLPPDQYVITPAV
ncbi:hypothetical protein CRI94_03680 [Longibacter salinarum]|uniref:Uncharacterized protein n=1 Tax=Longibacter salinarum TaxID=1850348 RepID=A0A2A8CZN2_9BACT|nr:hypothetical protein [Longibacter salinarum]PEN14152.1 hypothetical protein CRI94_03680 [Longibacter salinarum]